MVMFLVKLWCIFLDVLPSSEKTKFLSNGKNVLMDTLTKASEDLFLTYQLVGKKVQETRQLA